MRLHVAAKCKWRGWIKAPSKSHQFANWSQDYDGFCILLENKALKIRDIPLLILALSVTCICPFFPSLSFCYLNSPEAGVTPGQIWDFYFAVCGSIMVSLPLCGTSDSMNLKSTFPRYQAFGIHLQLCQFWSILGTNSLSVLMCH